MKQTHLYQQTHMYQRMPPLAIAMWFTGCFRMHKDGDGWGAVFRWWHPLTWVLFIAMIIPCAIFGEPIFNVIRLRLSPFWKVNLSQLQWVTPFTRLDTLKQFTRSALQ